MKIEDFLFGVIFSRIVTLALILLGSSFGVFFVFFKNEPSGAFLSIVSLVAFWENIVKISAHPKEKISIFEKCIYSVLIVANLINILAAVYFAFNKT